LYKHIFFCLFLKASVSQGFCSSDEYIIALSTACLVIGT
jgi:hypothetical protein